MSDISAYLTTAENNSYQLTVSWGEKPTGGFRIAIKETKLVGSTLQVFVETHSPAPDALVTMALTYPTAVMTLTTLPQGLQTPIEIIHLNPEPVFSSTQIRY